MHWYYITYYLLIISGIVAGTMRYQVLAKSSRLLLPLLASTLIVELITEFGQLAPNQSFVVYAIFQPVEFILLTGAYFFELKKRSLLATIPAYVLLSIVNFWFIQPEVFTSNMLLVTQVVTSLWALAYLRAMLQYPTQARFVDFTLFWICCGLLLFNASLLSLYGAYNFLDRSDYLAIGQFFRIVRITANHILYLTFLLSILSRQNKLENQ